jgi:hypothetical protein
MYALVVIVVSLDEVTALYTATAKETVWFQEAIDHNFEGIVFIFGIHLWIFVGWGALHI